MPRSWILLLAALMAGAVVGLAEPVTAHRDGTQVIFRHGTREVARYQAEPGPFPRADIPEVQRRGGYLHPLLTPSGRVVTDDFPANHLHHHGVWSAWASAVFGEGKPDFWNLGLGHGRVDFGGVDRVFSEDGAAGIASRHRFMDLITGSPRLVLEETWEIRVSVPAEGRPRHQLDLTLVQTNVSPSLLGLPEYHYGGLGFRGNWAWNGAAQGRFLTSNGDTNREAINGTRARWFWMGGPAGDGVAGVAILGHPGNFRSPQPVRLHPEEPFFCYAPQQMGRFEIRPGEPYRARYRLVVLDGPPEPREVEAWWEAYAAGR